MKKTIKEVIKALVALMGTSVQFVNYNYASPYYQPKKKK